MTRTRLTGVLLGFLVAGPALAEEVVYFQNGQAMRVDKTRREGKWLFLSLSDAGEMGVLLRQVKKVELAPALPPGTQGSSVAANLVSGGGSGGGYVSPQPIAESYDASGLVDDPAVAAAIPDQVQQQQQIQQQMQAAAAQGQELVPRGIRRGGRPTRR